MTVFEGDTNLPRLELDEDLGLLKILGRSVCVECFVFYKPLLAKLNEYVQNPVDTHVIVDLEYFNTTSSVALLDIFRTMSKVTEKGKKCKIDWYYEEDDIDLMESGEDYRDLLIRFNVEFNLIPK